ncbi:MAG: cupin domain-containing protein [Pseudotabrizicola sp.]|uniref:cupin domain-containing protein n=1 Tax=Pseudotabrizicola sp. TaxID=2939647 RepID=UPI002728FACE|nr:cupin domain-containing protein [Pseudotabrizicola sp.]MDO8882373.1 cupin domain-containing protein [Pseudotabrizicola sp.]MDP2079644.1 cupin domain-containing protein [Pseudotabrizicola sp.]MDZ7574593.1 cupin domain-containing protein [Pseudotabrizicola sp.]
MTKPKSISQLLPDGWQDMEFMPFREGVEICHLWQGIPDVALLRYAPGASVPRHRHLGLETILVLTGTQSDDTGTFGEGDLVFNPAGSEHRVWSVPGCVVLIQWERPVEFI